MGKALILTTAFITLLSGCGTASGFADATGRVFEGVSDDFRSLGDTIRR